MNEIKFDLEEIKKAMKEVPFGNSNFQIEHFIAKKESPERTYRQILLEINSKMIALKECEYRRKRLELDIEEIDYKIKESSGVALKRLEIDLEEKQFKLDLEIKYIEDAIIELSIYERIRKSLPQFTRDQFELSEKQYWKDRLLGDAKAQLFTTGRVDLGTIQVLNKIGIELKKNEVGAIEYEEKPLNQLESKL